MTYSEWVETVPATLKDDPLWKSKVYRLALFVGDLSWYDVCKLAQDRRTLSLSDQLYDASGGISATISEGYSRASRKDQVRFYEYALGSARETRERYYKGRFVVGQAVADHRMNLLAHIIRQLLKMVPKYRAKHVEEESVSYELILLSQLLESVPMPTAEDPTHYALWK